jgi:hypothetical protein
MRIFLDTFNIFLFKKDLISILNNLNISPKILSLLFFYKNPSDIDYLDKYKIKINFGKIKKLKISQKSEAYSHIQHINNNNYFYHIYNKTL